MKNKKLKENIRLSKKYFNWKMKILYRDRFRCVFCRKRNRLEVHHIQHFSELLKLYKIKSLKKGLFCNKLWDLTNGITLCKKCHNKIHLND